MDGLDDVINVAPSERQFLCPGINDLFHAFSELLCQIPLDSGLRRNDGIPTPDIHGLNVSRNGRNVFFFVACPLRSWREPFPCLL
jgi:hypothetical protein